MMNLWEETAVDREAVSLPLGFQGLKDALERIRNGRATYEDRARVLVLAEAVVEEGRVWGPIADGLRAAVNGAE